MSIIKEKRVNLISKYADPELTPDVREVSIHAEIYDSIKDFSKDLLTRRPIIDHYNMKVKNDYTANDFKQSHLRNYNEMLELLRNGYPPMVDRVRNLTKKSSIRTQNSRFGNSVAGFVPNVPNALMGLPKSMVGSVISNTGKVLDIYYSNSMVADYGPDCFIRAGEMLLKKLVDLEKQGYKFNLYACACFADSNNPFDDNPPTPGNSVDILCIKIKSSNKPLDLTRLSFPLSHPGFFRVAAFDWQATSPAARNLGKHRGTSLEHRYDSGEIYMIFRSMFGPNAIYLAAEDIYDSRSDEEDFIDSELKDQTEFVPGKKNAAGDSEDFKVTSSNAYDSDKAEKKAEKRSTVIYEKSPFSLRDLYGDPVPCGEIPLYPEPDPFSPASGLRLWEDPFARNPEEELRRSMDRLAELMRYRDVGRSFPP